MRPTSDKKVADPRGRNGPEAAFSFIPNQAKGIRRILRRPASTAAVFITKMNQNLPSMELGENLRTNRPCLSPAAKKREPNNKGAT
jgi:hypothetical protein